MSLENWMLKSGTTPIISLAMSGLNTVSIGRPLFSNDTLKFKWNGADIDEAPLLPQYSIVSLFDPNGIRRFVGIVNKIPVKGSLKEENQFYEIIGPWWNFENLVYQMDWYTTNGVTTELISTLRSMLIVNQNLVDQSLISLGDVVTNVITYVLTQLGLAQAAGTPCVPFQMGINTITTKIPLTEVKDKTCAQVIISMFLWVPDVVMWIDYTTNDAAGNPSPTINFDRRMNLQAVTLAAFNDIVESADLTPRYDLVVPAVVCKYNTPMSVDGNSYNVQTVDIFPVGAADPAFRNMVLDLDLEGGNETFQKQALVVTDRPTDYNKQSGTGDLRVGEEALGETQPPPIAISWLKGEHRADFLKAYTIPAGTDPDQFAYGAPGNDTLNDITVPVDENDFTVLSIITTLVDNAKAPLVLPSGTVAPGKGPGTNVKTGGNALDFLSEELLEGNVPPWLTDDQKIFSARVRIEITLQYTGSDPVIQNLFSAGPIFTKRIASTVNVTNGSTQTYSKLASETPAETPPVGLAQTLYEGLSVLHYEGQIGIKEDECSNKVSLNKTLNLSGSRNPAWAGMAAQVFEITENLDNGTTSVRLGPPKALTGQQWVDMLKASRGRVQTTHADERTTGQSGADNAVQGAGSTPFAGVQLPPSMQPSLPWRVFWRHAKAGGFEAKVNLNSNLLKSLKTDDNVTVTGLDTWFPITPSNDTPDKVWVSGTVTGPALNYTCSAATIKSLGNGGTDFDETAGPWTEKGYVQQDTSTPPQQNKFCLLIATIPADSNGNPVINARCSSHLLLKLGAENGLSALYPHPVGSS